MLTQGYHVLCTPLQCLPESLPLPNPAACNLLPECKKYNISECYGFDGSDYSDCDLLGCDIMKSYRWITVFQNNLLPPPSVSKWLKWRNRQVTPAGWQGIYEPRTRGERRKDDALFRPIGTASYKSSCPFISAVRNSLGLTTWLFLHGAIFHGFSMSACCSRQRSYLFSLPHPNLSNSLLFP
jgi:hypothetical protein